MSNMHDATNSGIPPLIEGIESHLSPFSVQETVEHLLATLQRLNLSLFAHIDHHAEAERVGLTMQEAQVLIFGNPKSGTPLMIASPLLALDLPLKVLIWQSADDHVWVSFTSVTYLQTRYALPQELIGNIAGIENVVKLALQG